MGVENCRKRSRALDEASKCGTHPLLLDRHLNRPRETVPQSLLAGSRLACRHALDRRELSGNAADPRRTGMAGRSWTIGQGVERASTSRSYPPLDWSALRPDGPPRAHPAHRVLRGRVPVRGRGLAHSLSRLTPENVPVRFRSQGGWPIFARLRRENRDRPHEGLPQTKPSPRGSDFV